MGGVWDFIQEQILGMQWLDDAVGTMLTAAGIDTGTRLGGSIRFFIYDSAKIMILLAVLIFLISYIQSYFPPERVKRILGHTEGIRGNIIGALLGTVTPFCSCSSIPVFIGFSKAGLPLGVTFSFLISSPFIDLAALMVLMSIFGPEIAIAYVVTGVLLAVAGGTLIGHLHMEDQIADEARPCGCCCRKKTSDSGIMTRRERASYSADQVVQTARKVWKYVLAGVLIGALIHNWIPEDVIQGILGDDNPFSVIIAAAAGIPIYADIFGTIPIAEALYSKGVGAGTILAFMMGVTALSVPSMMMLRSVVKPKLLAVFISVVVAGIIIIGYAFDFLTAVI